MARASCFPTPMRGPTKGERRFAILEKGAEVGGTWRDNSYPGAECDVQSHLYSYSFAAQARLEPALRGLAGNPAVHPRHHRALRRASVHPVQPAGDRAALRPGHGPLARHHGVGPRTAGAARRAGDRPAARAEPAAAARSRALRREGVPFGAVGSRLRPRRQAHRIDRHRRQRDPVLPAHRAGGRPAARLPAHARLGDPARRPHATARRRSGASGGSTAWRRLHRARLYWTNESRVWPIFHPALARGLQRLARWNIRRAVGDDDARAQADARLHDRLQARADLERVVPDVPPAERRTRDRRHPRNPRAARS